MPHCDQNRSQGSISMVTQNVCAVQETPSASVPCQAGEMDELAQAQMDDTELRRIIDCKKQADSLIPEDPELQRYSPLWNQLQMQGSRLVRIPPLYSDAASQVQVILPRSMVPKVLEQLHNVSTGAPSPPASGSRVEGQAGTSRRPRVQFGASWVDFRQPTLEAPAVGRAPLTSQEGRNPVVEDQNPVVEDRNPVMRDTGRIVGASQGNLPADGSASLSEDLPGPPATSEAVAVSESPRGESVAPSTGGGRSGRQRRLPVWSRDYQMSP
ncbi:hypothetical protein NQZ68_022234 [Dissostichus eleginoides]|nr:hypothetical protein NQZ68_022234 [Dissostichus eleginoides]